MKAEDNPFPYVRIVQGSTPASPAAGDQRVFVDSSGVLNTLDSTGALHPHAPVLLLEHLGTVPAGTAAGTLVLEKA